MNIEFPVTVSTELVAAMNFTPLIFTKVALKLEGNKLSVNPLFKASNSLGHALQRDRAWYLTRPLSTDPLPMQEWDARGNPCGPVVEAKVQNDEQTGWARGEDGQYIRRPVMVDGTTGYRREMVGQWMYRVWKPLVHDQSEGEFYFCDLLAGTCDCPYFQNPENSKSLDKSDYRVKRGCKHLASAWLAVVLGK